MKAWQWPSVSTPLTTLRTKIRHKSPIREYGAPHLICPGSGAKEHAYQKHPVKSRRCYRDLFKGHTLAVLDEPALRSEAVRKRAGIWKTVLRMANWTVTVTVFLARAPVDSSLTQPSDCSAVQCTTLHLRNAIPETVVTSI